MIELTTTTNYLTLAEIGDVVAIELIETSNKLELIVSNSGLKGDDGKHIESVSFVANDMVFVNDDLTTVVLLNAKVDLKGSDANVTKSNVKSAMDGDYESFLRGLSTGILSGGALTQNPLITTQFDIEAGQATFINSYSDVSNPVITHYFWPKIEGIEAEYISTAATTYVRIDKNGQVTQSTSTATEIERRDLVELGWIDHPNNATLEFFYQEPATNINLQNQFNDFLEAFKQFNIFGNDYTAASNDLTITRSAGKTFDNNANYANDIRNPHIISTEVENPCDIYYYYRATIDTWINDTPVTTTINPNKWDNGSGTLQDVQSGYWTIQLISYYAVYEANDIQYGQAEYATKEAALAAIKDAVYINPYNDADTFRAWLIVKQGTTDLSNTDYAIFKSGGKFGLTEAGSGSIGGSGGEVNTAANIGTLGVGLYDSKTSVTLNFKNIKPSSRISVTNNETSHTVDLDFVEDTTHRLVTDTQINTWNNKSELAIGETSTTAGAGDKTKTAYDHSQSAHAPSDANNYVHPANHPASIITQDTSNRFVTDAEKSTWNGKSDLTLGDLITNAYYGDKGKIGYDHSQTAHAPSNAQKNSDITKEEIEAKLIGEISTHTHASSGGLTQQQIEGLMI